MKSFRDLRSGRSSFWAGVLVLLGVGSVGGTTPAPFVFSGIPIDGNDDFKISVDAAGYSDSMLDYRAPFMGREYLSGEWAGAVRYTGGSLGGTSQWLTDKFVFPDFLTGSPFSQVGGFTVDALPNMYGKPVYRSVIESTDLEVSLRYETVDFGLSLASRFRIGLEANGLGGGGSYLESTRYGFKQTYEFKNKTAGTLTGFRFYQMLHSLYGDWGAYDARNYGGGMPGYMYGVTMQGTSLGFDHTTYQTVEHTDTVGMAFNHAPVSYEIGKFGMKNENDHQTGEPAVGVHKSIGTNTLTMADFFDPDETDPNLDAYVAGAAAFDLGSIPPGGTVSMEVLLALHTSYTVVAPPIDMWVHDISYGGGNITIDFEETTMNPNVGFILRSSDTGEDPKEEWPQVGVGYQIGIPGFPNRNRFLFSVDMEAEPERLFYIQPTIQNSF